MAQFDQHAEWRAEPTTGRRRRRLTSGALVGSGLLAGAILAGTLSANADEGDGDSPAGAVPAAATTSAPSSTPTTAPTTTPKAPDPVGSDRDRADWWRHHGGASVPAETATKVKDAVLAQYPDATIWWVRSDSDGGYDAYIDTADGTDLAVHLDDSFAITGTDDLPDLGGAGWVGRGWAGHGWAGRAGDATCVDGPGASVPADTATKVKDAVLAQYPDATIWWVRSDSDGGYDAYIDTADGTDLAVHLDDSFAITGTDDLPGPDGWWGHDGSPVSDETAAAVTDAVLAQYPGASVPGIWSDADDGGYHAVVVTADDERVVVHLDDSFAITSTDSLPGC